MKRRKKRMPAIAILSIGFLVAIIIGAGLLMLPIANRTGDETGFVDAVFTATSAVCVTGLIPFDTYTHWNLFGQIVILVLIQIGGLGFMTVITLLFMLFKKNIGIYNQSILIQSAGSYSIADVIPLLKKIVIGTAFFEGLGAILLSAFLWKDYGAKSIYLGLFHSISAFCNAGFDCFGSATGSLTQFNSNWPVLVTIMLLILIGGLGFITWSDIWDSKFKFKKFQMHTKIVLVWTLIIVFVPTILFLVFEFTKFGHIGHFTDLSLSDKILNSLFLSVSPRTAGFNSIELSELTSPGKLLTIVLMFIGGNPGSTAGGVKVTTVIIVTANLVASARGREDVTLFKQTVPNKVIKQSSALFMSYLILIIVSTILISAVEPFSFEEVIFEVTSAIATVGLTLGITSSLTIFSKVVIIFLMYIGRLGAFTLFDLLFVNRGNVALRNPEGRVLVG